VPIWLHLIVRIVCSIACLFGGALLGWLALVLIISGLQALGVRGAPVSLLAMLLGAILFLGGGYLGSIGGIRLLDWVPARCPQCRGLTCWTRTDYTFRRRRPITYHCSACGHVQGTGLDEGAGRLG
jgi:hypothetical protein